MTFSLRSAALAALLAIAWASPAAAQDFVQTMTCDRSGINACTGDFTPQPVHWPKLDVNFHINGRGSVKLYPEGDAFPTELEHSIRDSFDAWNEPECSQFTLTYQGVTDQEIRYLQNSDDNANVVLFQDDTWPYPSFQAVALTTVTFSMRDGRILDADIEVNGADYLFSNTELPNNSAMDLRNTLTHEVGHFLGLDHSSNASATMYATAELGEITKRDLHQADIDGLCHIYPLGTPEESPVVHEQKDSCSLIAPGQPDDSPLLIAALLGLGWLARQRTQR
ncbi:hypothetical protein DL240_12530 [Lujinxingia litoralis]|uniref:Peptidase metallopeptidase domain-containing protein n=1 Tax=Lujinxingia litoralis TaxID=2211119 RepID=A0A328C507_9DELT|nr:matrixin family metalloprotease [Lujinxingia litoralis]RAL21675.1 hypothetical protein DL240_12530 [Lujinxingia litoralis]